jgi:hypothetical protein
MTNGKSPDLCKLILEVSERKTSESLAKTIGHEVLEKEKEMEHREYCDDKHVSRICEVPVEKERLKIPAAVYPHAKPNEMISVCGSAASLGEWKEAAVSVMNEDDEMGEDANGTPNTFFGKQSTSLQITPLSLQRFVYLPLGLSLDIETIATTLSHRTRDSIEWVIE